VGTRERGTQAGPERKSAANYVPSGRAEWVVCFGCFRADAVLKVAVKVRPKVGSSGPLRCPGCKEDHLVEYWSRARAKGEKVDAVVDRLPA
jgi:hypothetical protein